MEQVRPSGETGRAADPEQAEQAPGLEWLTRLAHAVPAGVGIFHRGRLAWANERLVTLLGRGPLAELTGLALEELIEDDGQGLPDPAATRAVEYRLPRSGEEPRTVLCRAAAPSCGEEASIVFFDDVTHVRLLEAELLRSGRELQRANRRVASLNEQLRHERDEREELLTVVSHELRTPLTVINGYNRLLLSEQVGPLTHEQRGFLAESSNACKRLDRFIGDLLEASHATRVDSVLELAMRPLQPAVDAVVAQLRPILQDRHVSVRVTIPAGAERARFDGLRVEQVLMNLVGNAIRYSKPGGVICIESRPLAPAHERGLPEAPCVELAVADAGPGVSPEDRERIFEPYVRADVAGRPGGLGLGLAICKRIIDAHGGRIGCDAPPEGGSRFWFTLPASERRSVAAGERGTPEEAGA